MKAPTLHVLPMLAVTLALATGCQQRASSQRQEAVGLVAPVAPVAMAPMPRALPTLVVTRNPGCGCCGLWADAMREAGFKVEMHEADNLDPLKTRLGVPAGKGACHTAQVDGYFIEGHVPAADIKQLLARKPNAKGLVLPGMPAGAPGMEAPDGSVQPYTVELVKADGSTEPFAGHGRQGPTR